MPEIILIKPFLCLILLALICSLLGVFVTWKKLSYFGDALSHAVLLGIGLGALLEINTTFALIIFSLFFTTSISLITQNKFFTKDNIVMIFSYFCISSALILNDFYSKGFDFSSYLFGDILSVGSQEIKALCAIAIVTIFYTILYFKKILLSNVSKDFAKIEGIKTEILDLSFLFLLAVTIAVSMQIVGIFLMTALLVLPAATARIISKSAEQMMITSLLISIATAAFSFYAGSNFDLNFSAVIIEFFCIMFFATLLIKKLFN